MASQVTASTGTLALQVLAAHSLGAAGYGTFALLLAVLVVVTAVQTSWVGDSLTVLDRFDPQVRGSLLFTHFVLALAILLASALTVLLLDVAGPALALLFGAMAMVWVCEEACRRILMARLEFWRLTLCDAVFAAMSLTVILSITALGQRPSLSIFVTGMLIGGGAALAVAVLQIPAEEFRWVRPTGVGLREVTSFAAWRSAQAALRPLALLLTRVVIVALASRAVLGSVEAARLLVAPAFTFTAGISSFLLPTYSAEARDARKPLLSMRATVSSLVLVVTTIGILAVIFVDTLGRLLTNGDFPIERLTVAGWAAYAIAFSAGLAPSNALVARRRSRYVFILRAVELAVGLVLVCAVAASGRPGLAPFALTAGGVVGAVVLYRAHRAYSRAEAS